MLRNRVLPVSGLTLALATVVAGLLVPSASADTKGGNGTIYVQQSGTFQVCLCGGSECYPCASLQ
jgi:hypothetical protein